MRRPDEGGRDGGPQKRRTAFLGARHVPSRKIASPLRIFCLGTGMHAFMSQQGWVRFVLKKVTAPICALAEAQHRPAPVGATHAGHPKKTLCVFWGTPSPPTNRRVAV